LKAVASEIAEPLTVLFNQFFSTGLVPSVWKFSNVSPVHKGGVRDDPGNFYPISVVPVTKKSVRRQNWSPRTNFGSQNWSPLANFGPPHENVNSLAIKVAS